MLSVGNGTFREDEEKRPRMANSKNEIEQFVPIMGRKEGTNSLGWLSQRTLIYFVRRSITVQLVSSLPVWDSKKQENWLLLLQM